MDAITIEKIKLFHPKYRDMLLQQYTEANNLLGKGVRLRFAYVYRSPEEQHALFTKKPKVTQADSWKSIHQYAMAFDIVMLYDNDGNGTFEEASWSQVKDFDHDSIADWMEVTNYFKSKGWECGRDWVSFKDAPHFQLKKPDGTSYHWQELKAKIDSGDYKTENGIKYVNL